MFFLKLLIVSVLLPDRLLVGEILWDEACILLREWHVYGENPT